MREPSVDFGPTAAGVNARVDPTAGGGVEDVRVARKNSHGVNEGVRQTAVGSHPRSSVDAFVEPADDAQVSRSGVWIKSDGKAKRAARQSLVDRRPARASIGDLENTARGAGIDEVRVEGIDANDEHRPIGEPDARVGPISAPINGLENPAAVGSGVDRIRGA